MRALALLAILLSGCVTTTVTAIGESDYAATDPYDVELFWSEGEVPAPFEELGVIHAKNHGGLVGEEEMLRQAMRDAAALGANGLLLEAGDEFEVGESVSETMIAIRVHFNESERERAFSADGEDVKRIRVETFESWSEREAPVPPVDPDRVEAATEMALGLIFPPNERSVDYEAATSTVSIRFVTPPDYEIDYDDVYGRLRNNQWIALQQFEAEEVPVKKVIVETNEIDGRSYLRAVSKAGDVRRYARLPDDSRWRATAQRYVRGPASPDWVKTAD